ncbi:cell division control protein [Colletotrichum tofieldiae]|nr:cell division control protein [Colletotrichum tofieldiae]
MSRASLGKRTRSVQDQAAAETLLLTTCLGEIQLPAKRTRRQTRAALNNDENADPEATGTPELDCQLDDDDAYVEPARRESSVPAPRPS